MTLSALQVPAAVIVLALNLLVTASSVKGVIVSALNIVPIVALNVVVIVPLKTWRIIPPLYGRASLLLKVAIVPFNVAIWLTTLRASVKARLAPAYVLVS